MGLPTPLFFLPISPRHNSKSQTETYLACCPLQQVLLLIEINHLAFLFCLFVPPSLQRSNLSTPRWTSICFYQLAANEQVSTVPTTSWFFFLPSLTVPKTGHIYWFMDGFIGAGHSNHTRAQSENWRCALLCLLFYVQWLQAHLGAASPDDKSCRAIWSPFIPQDRQSKDLLSR